MIQTNDTSLLYTASCSANDGWSLVLPNGEKEPLEIVSRENSGMEDSPLIITRELDKYIGYDYFVCIQTKNEFVRAYVAGKLVYDYKYNTNGIGFELGSIWNLIELPVDSGGHDLVLEIIPMSGSHGTAPYPIYLGSRATIITELFTQKLPYIIICSVVLLFSLTLIIISIYKFLKCGQNAKAFLYLGLFAFVATVWVVADSLMLQFIVPNKAFSFMLFNCSFYLMPIPFALYMATVFKKEHAYFEILAVLTSVYFFIRLFLYTNGQVNFEYALFIIHLIMSIIIISVLALCIKNRKDKEHRYLFIAIISLAVVSAVSIIIFYAKDVLTVNRANYSIYFCPAILIFLLIISIGMLVRTYKLQKLANKAVFYEQCAYTDSLTGLLNRSSFEKELSILDSKIKNLSSVCMLVFDLNNLKKTNDSYGHGVGDELIINTFNCISDSFGSFGSVFRTGGDEVVVIITDVENDTVTSCIKDFEQRVIKYNEERLIPIDVAFGYSYFDNVSSLNMKATDFLRIADAEMYVDKQKRKRIKHKELY